MNSTLKLSLGLNQKSKIKINIKLNKTKFAFGAKIAKRAAVVIFLKSWQILVETQRNKWVSTIMKYLIKKFSQFLTATKVIQMERHLPVSFHKMDSNLKWRKVVNLSFNMFKIRIRVSKEKQEKIT
jgi:hypothetical protein